MARTPKIPRCQDCRQELRDTDPALCAEEVRRAAQALDELVHSDRIFFKIGKLIHQLQDVGRRLDAQLCWICYTANRRKEERIHVMRP